MSRLLANEESTLLRRDWQGDFRFSIPDTGYSLISEFINRFLSAFVANFFLCIFVRRSLGEDGFVANEQLVKVRVNSWLKISVNL